MISLPMVGQGYQLRSPAAAAQSCINVYPELIEDPNERAKNKAFLYGIPGRHAFKDLTSISGSATPIRGLSVNALGMFVVAGNKYMVIDYVTGTLLLGPFTVANPTGWYGLNNSPATFAFNGTQMFIVAGGVGYIHDIPNATFTTVTIGNFTGTVNVSGSPARTVDWFSGDKFLDDGSWIGKTIVINGSNYVIGNSPAAPTTDKLYVTSTVSVTSPPSYSYSVAGYTPSFITAAYLNDSFFANQGDSRAVNFSNVFDGTVWNGLNAISKDTWPDYVLGIISNGSQLFVFGDRSFDVFQANPGSATTFFSRIDGASSNIGAASPWSPISIDGRVYFMGAPSDGGGMIAYVLDGFTPRRISQHGQEAVWNAAGLGGGAISYSYVEEGHSFWVNNLGSQTWVFDTTTGAWHQRAAGAGFTAYPTAYHTSRSPTYPLGFKHFTGGPLDGTIYISSVAFYDDNGADIYWQKALPFSYNARNQIYDSRLELEMETGTAPSGAPTVNLDWSDDRGHMFSTPVSASIGPPGSYSLRVYWESLPSFTERVYRFTGNGQGRVALIDCEVERDLGTN